MIRFTWLQSRTQSAVALGALVVVAVVLAISGPNLVHLYDVNVASCGTHGDCSTATRAFLANDSTLRTWLGVIVVVIPGLVGIFWGAPLVAREIETGTFRLAWTQSITRTRWLAVRLGVIGLASMAVAGLLSLIVSWWASPLDRANLGLFGTFDQRDIVPIGYVAFAFALGVTAGLLIRRTLPAMVATLVSFVVARIAITYWVRPHLFAPMHQASAITSSSVVGYGSTGTIFSGSGPSTVQLAPPNLSNAWIYSTQIVDRAGHVISPQVVSSICPSLGHGGPGGGAGGGHTQAPASAVQGLQECGAMLGAKFHELVTYQPPSRFWALQWYELAIYLGVTFILCGFSLWWVRRRLV
jgi:hypothetical protein